MFLKLYTYYLFSIFLMLFGNFKSILHNSFKHLHFVLFPTKPIPNLKLP